jgi:hypothetical protein
MLNNCEKNECLTFLETGLNEKDSFRQPVFKGIRDDKLAIDCKV